MEKDTPKDTIATQKVWDDKTDAYNAIPFFLETKGLKDEDVLQCMQLVMRFKNRLMELYSLRI